ncbi:MAG: lysine--tRNA ligase [Pseudomonadota bacterium]
MTNIEETLDENAQIALRKEKLSALRQSSQAYPNHFRRQHLAADLHRDFSNLDKDTLQQSAEKNKVSIAGRIMTRRLMGKASFIHLQDMSGKIQVYIKKNDLPEGIYEQFKHWDIGDIIGVRGYVFKTNTGELSIHAQTIELLTKSLRPLPDKFHGLVDQEVRYRQRYVDLIANEETRQVFFIRSKTIAALREYLLNLNYIEVETPMMHAIPGGALAKPFTTYHNALDMPLYLRVAPELYLKRLVVGGFENVFEINRNFRNEGISTRHNPEFTMLEFYQAYSDYEDMIDLTEKMFSTIARQVLGDTVFTYQGHQFDFGKTFDRMTIKEAIIKFADNITDDDLNDLARAKVVAEKHGIEINANDGLGKLQMALFEEIAEDKLIQPTFITGFSAEVSPLSRCNDDDPFYVDRFELFIAGREIANGFSELNDPEDQAERFRQQIKAKAAGDEEAMYYDDDYITALEHGLPPTAGEGIGIDRLVMLFTNSPSIRDVLFFPHLRLNSKTQHK